MKKAAALLAAALVATPAAADHLEIKVDDTSTVLPSARIGIDISPRGERPSVPHSGHGIELGLTGTTGKGHQTRTAGAPPLVFGGQVFAAPNELNQEFDFAYVELVYRFRHFFGEGRTFGIEALGGLGYAEYDLTITTPTQRANDNLASGGLVLGFGVIWKFLPTTSLQSRLTLFGSGQTEGVTGAGRWDLFVAQALGRHAAVRAGITGWGLTSSRDDEDDFSSVNSLIRASFSGFAVGLELAF
jgi:hypothetical protein